MRQSARRRRVAQLFVCVCALFDLYLPYLWMDSTCPSYTVQGALQGLIVLRVTLRRPSQAPSARARRAWVCAPRQLGGSGFQELQPGAPPCGRAGPTSTPGDSTSGNQFPSYDSYHRIVSFPKQRRTVQFAMDAPFSFVSRPVRSKERKGGSSDRGGLSVGLAGIPFLWVFVADPPPRPPVGV